MKGLLSTLRNIWKIEDLRLRILTTLGFVLIYRLGSFVTLPGIDPNQLQLLESQTSDGLLGLLNLFTGGAFSSFNYGTWDYALHICIDCYTIIE